MAKYLNPKADLTFKKIFGEHPRLVISLLNALLPLKADERVESIEYWPAEMRAYDKFWDNVSVQKTLDNEYKRKAAALLDKEKLKTRGFSTSEIAELTGWPPSEIE